MNSTEAFKFGFLLRCAHEGLSPAGIQARIVKTASLVKSGFDLAGLAGNVGRTAGMAALVAPPVLGALGGYGLATVHDDAYDVDEAKKEEELAEYYRVIDQLGRSKRLQGTV